MHVVPRFDKSKQSPLHGKRGKAKTTLKCREMMAIIADEMAPEFKKWLRTVADGNPSREIKPDPKGAADLYLKAIEYHIPKLARTEVDANVKASIVIQAIAHDDTL